LRRYLELTFPLRDQYLLTGIHASIHFSSGVTAILLSLYLVSIGADFVGVSAILTSFVAASMIAGYVWGQVADRVRQPKLLFAAALGALAAVYFLLVRADSVWAAWALRIVEGIFSGAAMTIGLALIADATDRGGANEGEERRGRSIGAIRGFGSVSFAAGAVLGGQVANQSSTGNALYLCAIAYVVAAVAALFITPRPETPRQSAAQPAAARPVQAAAPVTGISWIGRIQLPILFIVGIFLWTAAHSASASLWPNYLASLGYSTSTTGNLWALAACVEMVAMVGAGIVSDRVGRIVILVFGGAMMSVVNGGYMALAGSPGALAGLQLLRGVGYGSYTTGAMTFAAESGPRHQRGATSGLFNATSTAGRLAGTLWSGIVVQYAGFGAMYAVCAMLALTSALLFWRLSRPATVPAQAQAISSQDLATQELATQELAAQDVQQPQEG
jgi:DHA1 family multidrug resistance protein-like MFS transporter